MKVLLEGLNIFDVNLYTFDVRFPYNTIVCATLW